MASAGDGIIYIWAPWTNTLHRTTGRGQRDPVEQLDRVSHLLAASLRLSLPPKYHKSLLHENLSEAKYFSNAAKLLLNNEVHSLEYWNVLRDEFYYTERRVPNSSGFFKDNGIFEANQVRFSLQSMLEPSVLLQLPFFPVALYDWLLNVHQLYKKNKDFADKHLVEEHIPQGTSGIARSYLLFVFKFGRLMNCASAILSEMVEAFPESNHQLADLLQNSVLPCMIQFIKKLLNIEAMDKIRRNMLQDRLQGHSAFVVFNWENVPFTLYTSKETVTATLLKEIQEIQCNASTRGVKARQFSYDNFNECTSVIVIRNQILPPAGFVDKFLDISGMPPTSTGDLYESITPATAQNSKGTEKTQKTVRMTAEKFKSKIQMLVKDMFKKIACEKRYTSASIKIWQWNQYILPCFASSLLTAQKIRYFKKNNLDNLAQLIEKIIDNFQAYFEYNLDRVSHQAKAGSRENYSLDSRARVNHMIWKQVIIETNLLIFDHTICNNKFEGIPGLKDLIEILSNGTLTPDFNWIIHNNIDPSMYGIFDKWLLKQQVYSLNILQAVRLTEIDRESKPLLKNMLSVHNFLDTVLWHVGNLGQIRLMLELAHIKIHCLKRQNTIKHFSKVTMEGYQQHVNFMKEVDGLSFKEIFHFTLYYLYYRVMKEKELTDLAHQIQDTISCLDQDAKELADYFMKKDWARVRMLLMPKLNPKARSDSSHYLKFHKLQSQYPLLLKMMSPGIRDGKVVMEKPGQIVMIPLKHCRWCGEFKAKLKMCEFCEGNYSDYPDVTWYCEAGDCEEKSVEQDHREEHARFIIILLEIGDPGPQN